MTTDLVEEVFRYASEAEAGSRSLVCARGSGSRVPPGVSAHDGLDREPGRERDRNRDAKKPGELAVAGGICIRSDNPPKRVPESKSCECCEAGHNRYVGQPPWHTRERGTTADYSQIGTSQHQEGKHPAGEQAHRQQGGGQEVPLPDGLVEAHSGTERKRGKRSSQDRMPAQARDDGPVAPGNSRRHPGTEGPEPAAFPEGDEDSVAEPVIHRLAVRCAGASETGRAHQHDDSPDVETGDDGKAHDESGRRAVVPLGPVGSGRNGDPTGGQGGGDGG